jgi:signal transduction histidine kinase
VCDRSGIIQTYNNRAVELWGREPKAGDAAQHYCASLRLYSPEGELVPHEESKMAEVLRTGVEASDLEVAIERPDGSFITVLVNIAPLRNADGDLVGAMNCFQDITARKQAAKELAEANQQLRLLSRRLFEIQEEERRHLARELHDEIGQTLTAAKINTDMLRAAVPPDLAARLNENATILDRLLQQTRQISLDLRPPHLDDLGLAPALRWYVHQQAERAGLEAKFSADPLADDVPSHIQVACFRLAQEAITNVVRHARAKTLSVELRQADSALRLRVRDDGGGFDVALAEARAEGGASLGLLGMKERAAFVRGTTRIISYPGKGTTVEILLPLDRPQSALPVSGNS